MKKIIWNEDKALLLRSAGSRNQVGFEDCALAIENGRVLDDISNPSPLYPHQRIFVLEINGYAHAVPYISDEKTIFLKTVFPSRKYTVMYLKEKHDDQ